MPPLKRNGSYVNGIRLDILLFVIRDFDRNNEEQIWQTIRQALLSSVILPLARKATSNQYWVLQFYAAQSFELYAEKEDTLLITQLINSKSPIVRLAALYAALKHGSETAFDDIITQIQHQPQLTQSVYLQAFTHAPATTHTFIDKFLKIPGDHDLKITCYRILLSYPPIKIDWNIAADIHSDNESLKLAALKFIAYAEKESAIPILINLLQDSNWETKVVVLNALGYLKAENVIPDIVECLHDENWWVKLSAAQALKNLGDAGEHALTSDRVKVDPKAFEVVRHVLHML